MSTHLAKKRFM
jgi:hypothetical protein